jgi:lipoprotein-releasing system ATP-binding protein
LKLIHAENVYKHYMRQQTRVEVLQGVQMEIEAGEMVAVIGPSGTGKSTLLHLLGGLDHPSSGVIYYNGVALDELRDEQLADFRNRQIGFVFQFHHLLPEFSALENVMMPALIQRRAKHEAREEAQQLLMRVGLGDRLDHRPGELSGGEQQRVAVARALANAPSVVFADVPTGNLDRTMGQSLQQLLRQLNQERGQTFVIVTHDREFAAQMDRVVSLMDGKVSAV